MKGCESDEFASPSGFALRHSRESDEGPRTAKAAVSASLEIASRFGGKPPTMNRKSKDSEKERTGGDEHTT
jgi:hypothetical protein